MARTSRFMKQLHTFLGTNSRLFLFLSLTLIGVTLGCIGFSHVSDRCRSLLSLFAAQSGTISGFSGALFAFLRHSLPALAAIGVLMLSGMSLCGIPAVFIIPVAYGAVTGLCEAFTLEQGGVVALALSLPATLVFVWTLLIACAESLRLTLRLVAQVMPCSPKSGLWRDFRMYFWRFLLCFSLAIAASAMDVALAMLV